MPKEIDPNNSSRAAAHELWMKRVIRRELHNDMKSLWATTGCFS